MEIFSSDPVIMLVAGLMTLMGIVALILVVSERQGPILRAFFLAAAYSAFACVCLLQWAWTGLFIWNIGTTVFGVLMFYDIGCMVLRWWKKWGPA